jgi:hypothetical protein
MFLIALALDAIAPPTPPAPPPPSAHEQPSASAETPEETRPSLTRPPFGSSLKGSAGGYYGQLYSIPTYGGEASIAAGPFFGKHFYYFAFDLQRGRTEHGLAIWTWHVGASTEWSFDRIRVGGTARLGGMSVERVTSRETQSSGSIGASIHGSVDVARFKGDSALFIVASFRADFYSAPTVWGPSLALGYRWDLVTHD